MQVCVHELAPAAQLLFRDLPEQILAGQGDTVDPDPKLFLDNHTHVTHLVFQVLRIA